MHSITQPLFSPKLCSLILVWHQPLGGHDWEEQGAVEAAEKAYLASCWPSKLGSVGNGEGLAVWSLVLAACSIGSKGGFEEESSGPCSQLFQNPYSDFRPLAVILHTFLFTQLPILVSDLAFQLHPSNLLILIPNLCSPSVQFSSVAQSRPTLCHPMDCSMPGLPVHHQPGWVYSNSCPSSQWCHPTISSSVVPFSHPQSFPASEFFQISQFSTSGGQSIGVLASTSVLPMSI